MTDPGPDHLKLLEAARRGDESAFRVLYRRHNDRLRGVVLRLVGFDHDLADDLLQETWIHAVKGLGGLREVATFEAWLIAIAARRTWTSLRQRHRRSQLRERYHDVSAVAHQPPHADLVDVERALANLPDLERTIMVLSAVEGYSHGEIAGMLDIPVGTSRATLFRARESLRAQLVVERPNGRAPEPAFP